MAATMERRALLRVLGIGALAAPVLLAQEVVKRQPQPLPPFRTGQVMTKESLNALVDRLNLLSESA